MKTWNYQDTISEIQTTGILENSDNLATGSVLGGVYRQGIIIGDLEQVSDSRCVAGAVLRLY